MACLVQNQMIDGKQYTVTQFPARMGLSFQSRLLKLIGPALSKIRTDDVSGSQIDLSMLIDKLDDQNVVQLVIDLLSQTKRDKKDIDAQSFDIDFAGDYIHLVKVVGFVIKANGFFGGGDIGKLLSRFSLPANGTEISPKGSTKA